MTLRLPADLCRAAATQGIVLSESEATRLVQFAELLQRWNQRINLTASRTVEDILERQVLDCLMGDLLPWPSAAAGQTLQVVDIGSGAGLPGLVIALRHPQFQVTLLERTAKKISFQREAVRLLELPQVTLLQEDAWSHAARIGHRRYDVALARAFADLAATLPLAAELLRPGGWLRTFKGKKLPQELAAIPPGVRSLFATEIVQRSYEVPGTALGGTAPGGAGPAGTLVQFQRL